MDTRFAPYAPAQNVAVFDEGRLDIFAPDRIIGIEGKSVYDK